MPTFQERIENDDLFFAAATSGAAFATASRTVRRCASSARFETRRGDSRGTTCLRTTRSGRRQAIPTASSGGWTGRTVIPACRTSMTPLQPSRGQSGLVARCTRSQSRRTHFVLRLVCHDLRVQQLAAGDPVTRKLTPLNGEGN